MFLQLFVLTLVLVGISLAGLGIRMLLLPNGRFPDTHVGHNKAMKERGITCAKNTDTGCSACGRYNSCSGEVTD